MSKVIPTKYLVKKRLYVGRGTAYAECGSRELLILGEGMFVPDALSIVADGDRFVVAWSAVTDVQGRILSSIVDREGTVRGPFQIGPGLEDKRRPSILRTAAGGLVFYYDRNVPETPIQRSSHLRTRNNGR